MADELTDADREVLAEVLGSITLLPEIWLNPGHMDKIVDTIAPMLAAARADERKRIGCICGDTWGPEDCDVHSGGALTDARRDAVVQALRLYLHNTDAPIPEQHLPWWRGMADAAIASLAQPAEGDDRG